MSTPSYVVQLQKGLYLTDGEGDPPRTHLIENAKVFRAKRTANIAINKARKYKPYRYANAIQHVPNP